MPLTQEEKLDEALKETFPASDAFYLPPERPDRFDTPQILCHGPAMAKRAKKKAPRQRSLTDIAADVLQAVRGKPPALTPKGTKTPAAKLRERAKRPRKAATARSLRVK
jgi:hypothetical protein